jgi:hypothetical protein
MLRSSAVGETGARLGQLGAHDGVQRPADA